MENAGGWFRYLENAGGWFRYMENAGGWFRYMENAGGWFRYLDGTWGGGGNLMAWTKQQAINAIQLTAQETINALTAVSVATNEHVLTKDTVTGNAVFKTKGYVSMSEMPALELYIVQF